MTESGLPCVPAGKRQPFFIQFFRSRTCTLTSVAASR